MIDSGDKLVVIDFFATWCTPCQMIVPKLRAIERDHPDVAFYKINVDENKDTTEYYSVTAMPTFILFKNGVALDKVKGANPTALKTLIEKYINDPAG